MPNATAADAELVLKLYELRREPTMRKAREFIVMQYWPTTWEEFWEPLGNFGSEANNYFRQVTSYWEMAASLANSGAMNAELFNESNGEMYFIYAKFEPFIERARKERSPEFLTRIEQAIKAYSQGEARLKVVKANIEKGKEARALAKAAGKA